MPGPLDNQDPKSNISTIRKQGAQAAEVLNAPRRAYVQANPQAAPTAAERDLQTVNMLKRAGATIGNPFARRSAGMDVNGKPLNVSPVEGLGISAAKNLLLPMFDAVEMGVNVMKRPIDILRGLPDPYQGNQQAYESDVLETAGNIGTAGLTGEMMVAKAAGRTAISALKHTPDRTNIFGSSFVDQEAVVAAKAMQQEGKAPTDIWRETGVWEYRPGKWISETDDSMLALKSDAFEVSPEHIMQPDPNTPNGWGFIEDGTRKTFRGNLGDVMTDGDVFNYYPAARDIETNITIIENTGNNLREGSIRYDLQGGKYVMQVTATSEEQARATIIHEIQHYVQEMDNLPAGGNSRDPFNKDLWEQDLSNKFGALIGDMHDAIKQSNMSPEAQSAAIKYTEIVRGVRKPSEKKLQPLRDKFINEMPEDIKTEFFNTESEVTNNLNEKYPGGRAIYDRLSGEVMARLAAARSYLDTGMRGDVTPMYNAKNPMGLKEDVRPDLQIDSPRKMDGTSTNAEGTPSMTLQQFVDAEKHLSNRLNQINAKIDSRDYTRAELKQLMDEKRDVQSNLLLATKGRNEFLRGRINKSEGPVTDGTMFDLSNMDEVTAQRMKKFFSNDNTPMGTDVANAEKRITDPKEAVAKANEEYAPIVDAYTNVFYGKDKFFTNRFKKAGIEPIDLKSIIDEAENGNKDELFRMLNLFDQADDERSALLSRFTLDIIRYFKYGDKA